MLKKYLSILFCFQVLNFSLVSCSSVEKDPNTKISFEKDQDDFNKNLESSRHFIFTKNITDSGTFLLKSNPKSMRNKKYYKYSYVKNSTPIKILKSVTEPSLDLYLVRTPGGIEGYVLKKNVKKISYNNKNTAVVSIIDPYLMLVSEKNITYSRSDNVLLLTDRLVTKNGQVHIDVIDLNKNLRYEDIVAFNDEKMEVIPLKAKKFIKIFPDKLFDRLDDIKALKKVISWDCSLEQTVKHIIKESTELKVNKSLSLEIPLIEKYLGVKVGGGVKSTESISHINEVNMNRIIKKAGITFKAKVFTLHDAKNLIGRRYAILKKYSCDINSGSTKRLQSIKLLDVKSGNSCLYENEKNHSMFMSSANSKSLFVLSPEYFFKNSELEPFSIDYYMSSTIRRHFYKCDIFDDIFNINDQNYFLKELLKPIFLDYHSFDLLKM